MSLERSNAESLRSAQRANDARLPGDGAGPDCPDCGSEMDGFANRWEWEWTCPKCGHSYGGDCFPDKPDPFEEF